MSSKYKKTSCRSCSGLVGQFQRRWIRCSQFFCYYCSANLYLSVISQARCGFSEFSKRNDVEGIKYVINFDYPNSSEDYIHRIGRTGRSDTTGTSYAFFTPNNFKQAKDLVSVLKEANQVINPKLSEIASRCDSFGGGKSGRWGYRNNFRGRENNGPRTHTRYGGGPSTMKQNGYSNGGLSFKPRKEIEAY